MLTGVLILVSMIFSLPLCTDYQGDISVKDESNKIEDPSPVPDTLELVNTNNAVNPIDIERNS